jgi:DNA-binding SARP family transcriptional activator/tetratricopeptide (TPR) repeat protein
MLTLRTFGGLTLLRGDIPLAGAAVQRRRLALLARVAAAGRAGAGRGLLMAQLWPDADEEHARRALNQLVYALRRDLGDEVLTGANELRLDARVIASDVESFRDAVDRGDWERAAGAYRGPFLDGFHLIDMPEYLRWADDERDALARDYTRALTKLAAAAAARGDRPGEVDWLRRLTAADRHDSRAALRLVEALAASGDRAGALRHAQVHEAMVRTELGVDAGPEMAGVVARLKREPAAPAALPPNVRPAADGPPAPADAVALPATATQPRRRHVSHRAAAVGAAAALGAAAFAIVGWLATRPPSVPALGQGGHRDWVIIADVADSGTDRAFDRAMALALTTGLEQSPRVTVMPASRIGETLVRMRRPPAETLLDERTAREVAERDGARVVVVPAVARADSGYVLTARIIDPQNGNTLAAELARARTSAGVLDALDQLSRALRRDFGESALSSAHAGVPLPRATTRSLDALEKFAAGRRAFDARHDAEAEDLWKAAIALDSDFALAHVALGGLYYWDENRRPEGDAHFARATALLGRLPEGEQTLIRANIAGWRGDRLGAVRIYRAYLMQHPDDPNTLFQLGYNAMRGHEYAEARTAFARLAAIDSTDFGVWINIATVDRSLGELRPALDAYHRAFALYPEAATTGNMNNEYGAAYIGLGMLDSAERVYRTMLAVDGAGASPRRRDGYQSLAFLSMWRGRYRAALADLDSALVIDRALGDQPGAARQVLLAAELRFALGEPRAARRDLAAFDSVFRRTYLVPTMLLWAGRIAARDGDAARAAVFADSLERRANRESREDQASIAMIRGELALLAGQPNGARDRLAEAQALDRGAYLDEAAAHAAFADSDFAAASRMYGALSGISECCFEGSEFARLAPYWVGRSEEAQRHRDAATAAYRVFLSQWADADSDLVAVHDARQRLSVLAH